MGKKGSELSSSAYGYDVVISKIVIRTNNSNPVGRFLPFITVSGTNLVN